MRARLRIVREETGAARQSALFFVVVLTCSVAALAGLSVASAQTPRTLTIDPGATGSEEGFLDLASASYAEASAHVAAGEDLRFDTAVAGLPPMEVGELEVYDNTTNSMAFTGTTTVLGVPAQGLVTAVWADPVGAPSITIGFKFTGDDLDLSSLNPEWSAAYVDIGLESAWAIVTDTPQTLSPDDLPSEIASFYGDDAIELGAGVEFSAEVDTAASPDLSKALGYVGHNSPTLTVAGTLGSSAAMFDDLSSDQDTAAAGLDLEVTLESSGGGSLPSWLDERATTIGITATGGTPAISIEDEITVTVDNTTNTFVGTLAYDPDGPLEVELAIDGPFDAPFDMGGFDLANVALALSLESGDEGTTLQASLVGDVTVNGATITLNATFEKAEDDTITVSFSIAEPIAADDALALAGEIDSVDGLDASELGDFVLSDVTFTFSKGAETTFSFDGTATIAGVTTDVLLSVHSSADAKKLIAGIAAAGNVDLESWIDEDIPGVDLTITDPHIAFLQGWGTSGIATDDLSDAEVRFFESAFADDMVGGALPSSLDFVNGLNLAAGVPVTTLGAGAKSALGLADGAELELRGKLGVSMAAFSGGTGTFDQLSLEAVMPAMNISGLPEWVAFDDDPWKLKIGYGAGAFKVSIEGGFDLTVGGDTLSTDAAIEFQTGGGSTTLALSVAAESEWETPFGVDWLTIEDLGFDATLGAGQIEIELEGTAQLAGKDLSVGVGISRANGSTSAHFSLSTSSTFTMTEILDALQVDDLVALPSELDNLSIGPLSLSAQAGGGNSSFALNATTSIELPESSTSKTATLFLEVGGGDFIFAVKPNQSVALSDFVSGITPDPTLEEAAIVVSKSIVKESSDDLSDEAFDYFKTAHGCEAADSRSDCDDFELELPSGLGFDARLTLPSGVEAVTDGLWIDAEDGVSLHGKLPIFGGSTFGVRAELPGMDPPDSEQPDWFHSGRFALEINNEGMSLDGGLGIRLRHGEATTDAGCDASLLDIAESKPELGKACYDVLNFEVKSKIEFAPPSVELQGRLKTDEPWVGAFGEDWLTINELVLQLGLKVQGTPAFTFGFLGDVAFDDKDLRASASMTLQTITAPPFVIPILNGISAYSKAGVSLQDIVAVQKKMTGVDIPISGLPSIEMRNLDFMFAIEQNAALCLRPGLHLSGDLYINGTGTPAGAESECSGDLPDLSPKRTQFCKDNRANGCFASALLDISPTNGIVAHGDLAGFSLGPISMDEASLDLELTKTKQRFGFHGGATIGDFAKGRVDVEIGTSKIDFKGEVDLFGTDFEAYLEGSGTTSLSAPGFRVRAALRADFSQAATAALDTSLRGLKHTAIALDEIWDIVRTGDPAKSMSMIADKLNSILPSGTPSEISAILTTIGKISADISKYGGNFGIEHVLNGFDVGTFPGIPGTVVPETCLFKWSGGRCWTVPPGCVDFGLFDVCSPGVPGTIVPATCITTWQDGKCWTVPPFDIPAIPGVCQEVLPKSQYPAVWTDNWCSTQEFLDNLIGPMLRDAFKEATGVAIPANWTLTKALDDLTSQMSGGVSLAIECAEFEGELGALSAGGAGAKVGMAARLNLFGWKVKYGADWNFNLAASSNAEDVFTAIVNALFSPSNRECIGVPQSAPSDAAATGLSLSLANGTITEGGSASLSGEILGNITGSPSVKINWGDGSAVQTVSTTSKKFNNVTHSYADDGASGVAGATYAIVATVDDAGAKNARTTLTVNNAAPSGLQLTAPATLDENGTASVSGSFSDAGVPDSHTIVIDWGDGTTSAPTRTGSGGTYGFSATHQYKDDNPTSTAFDNYTIKATVTDDDTGTASTSKTLKVSNVAPSAVTMNPTEVVNAAGQTVPLTGGTTAIDEGSIVTYSGSFTDPGSLDSHEVTIDWKDGTTSKLQIPVGNRTFITSHRFEDDNPTNSTSDVYAVGVAVKDDDAASTSITSSLTVRNVAPSDVTLAATGTSTDTKVNEDQEAQLAGGFLDPGDEDTHKVTIKWGDGTSNTVVNLAAGVTTFAANHKYVDDNPTGTSKDDYKIEVSVVDDDGGSASTSKDTTIHNVAPFALDLDVESQIDEDGVAHLSGTYSDPGTLDTYTVDIDWGDGSADTQLKLVAGKRSFDSTHRYLDDNPTGTAADNYTIDVTVTDDDTGSDSERHTINVENVAPDLTFTVDPTIHEHDVATVDATFVDPGTKDTYEAVIDWGDGSTDTTFSLPVGARGFKKTHRFLDDNPTATNEDTYTVTVTLTDDDTGQDSMTSDVLTKNHAPQDLVLTPVDTTINENETIAFDATFGDIGTLDTHTVEVNWGEGWDPLDLTNPSGKVITTSLPHGTYSFHRERVFGDDGSYTVKVRVTDDDTESVSSSFDITVSNVDPVVDIDDSATAGTFPVPLALSTSSQTNTFFGRRNSEMAFSARATDRGSDDITFKWDFKDGTMLANKYLLYDPDTDKDPSPQVSPRDETNNVRQTWKDPCLYWITVDVPDDDGGTVRDTVPVVISDLTRVRWAGGFWAHQYADRGADDTLSDKQLLCYLDMVNHVSGVFGEPNMPTLRTIPQAAALLGGTGSDERTKLDRELLGIWLDLANGAFRYDEMVDTNLDGVDDVRFSELLRQSEVARRGTNTTTMKRQREKLQNTR